MWAGLMYKEKGKGSSSQKKWHKQKQEAETSGCVWEQSDSVQLDQRASEGECFQVPWPRKLLSYLSPD